MNTLTVAKPKRKNKLGAGRPPKTVANCLPVLWKEIIIDMCSQGMSDVEVRAKLCLAGGKFSYDTWYALKDREMEFSETLEMGKVLCESWWQTQGRESIGHKRELIFETGLWAINMRNRFGWSDKEKVDVDVAVSVILQTPRPERIDAKTENRIKDLLPDLSTNLIS